MSLIDRFRPDINTLAEFRHWTVLFRDKQVTLGAVIIAAKREVPSIADLSAAEAAELPVVAGWYENLTRELFQPERFNYVAAMMKDPFVHFHAFPRYSSDRHVYDSIWRDVDWPKVVQFSDDIRPETVLDAIRTDMRRSDGHR